MSDYSRDPTLLHRSKDHNVVSVDRITPQVLQCICRGRFLNRQSKALGHSRNLAPGGFDFGYDLFALFILAMPILLHRDVTFCDVLDEYSSLAIFYNVRDLRQAE